MLVATHKRRAPLPRSRRTRTWRCSCCGAGVPSPEVLPSTDAAGSEHAGSAGSGLQAVTTCVTTQAAIGLASVPEQGYSGKPPGPHATIACMHCVRCGVYLGLRAAACRCAGAAADTAAAPAGDQSQRGRACRARRWYRATLQRQQRHMPRCLLAPCCAPANNGASPQAASPSPRRSVPCSLCCTAHCMSCV